MRPVVLLTFMGFFFLLMGVCQRGSIAINNNTSRGTDLAFQVETPNTAATYTARDPIYVTSDAELATFPGAGTIEDPYIISGFQIEGNTTRQNCIYLGNTQKFVVIKECRLFPNGTGVEPEFGVSLYNATNVTVLDCEFVSDEFWDSGVEILNSTGVLIRGNYMADCKHEAIRCIGNSSSVIISGNNIIRSWSAIIVGYNEFLPFKVSNISITTNYLYRDVIGIEGYNVQGLNITQNFIHKPSDYWTQPYLVNCTSVLLTNNTIVERLHDGTLQTLPFIERYVGKVIPFFINVSGGYLPLTYNWDFDDPDGITSTYTSGATHMFSKSGVEFNVTVTITDADGETLIVSQLVSVKAEEVIPGYPVLMLLVISAIGVAGTWMKKKQRVVPE